MQFATLLAGAVETALAKLLTQHPNPQPLTQWRGQVIHLQLQPLPVPLYLVMTDPVQVYSRYDGELDCSLIVTISALQQLKQGTNLTELAQAGEIYIDGDLKLAGQLANLLAAIEPDLAEPLSKVVGGAMAHRLDRFGRNLFNRASDDLKRLQQHSRQFVRDELQPGVTTPELNQFAEQVSQLEQRVTALRQRLAKHEGKPCH
ncbi:ubiquinone biosynthesis accessory factor UbiJ [Ferrimonas senticii]|uniref:ubiquinone biosynthesis accessory factor UbiJ n=1 Tax=Ferrimonas senticii TaxID=394566 RepID=UPI0004156277|nr:SCP2 sterol-binding domain-containing protein [Ferrimonas senticii]